MFTATGAAETIGAGLGIAKNPGSSTITSLYTLVTGTPPFSPGLPSQPNDFTLPVSYTGSELNSPGGIAIDAQAQVLDTTGKPIPGLLAAGATTGGLEGGRDAVYIGGLIKAGAFALVAAERAASLQNKTPAPTPSAAIPAPAKQGLARFPILNATLRYGKPVAAALGLLIAVLTILIAWPSLGLLAIVAAAAFGAVATIAVLAFVELIQMITELLISN